MKNILRLSAILFAITAVAGLILGVVRAVTLGPIEELQAKMQVQAMQETLPQAERFEDLEVPEGYPLVASISAGYSGDQVVGWDVTVTPSGYGGTLSIMVGVAPGGVIQGIKVLNHTETPGLGANSARPEFAQQFAGKRGPLSVTKGSDSSSNTSDATSSAPELAQPSGGDTIQALTGATVTSNAVVAGVNAALALTQQLEQSAVPSDNGTASEASEAAEPVDTLEADDTADFEEPAAVSATSEASPPAESGDQ